MQKQTEAKRFAQIGPRAPTVPWSEASGSVFTPVVLGALFIGFIAFAIVIGLRTADIQTKVTATRSTVTSVSIVSTCNESATQVRRAAAYQVRLDNAFRNYAQPIPCHENNRDETLYASTHFSSYSKGLQHDSFGHVSPSAYAALLKAVESGLPSDFDAIPLASGSIRKLTNPQGGLGFVAEGGDPASFVTEPAPAFASAEQAGEAVEHYWMSLSRDVPFADYATNNITVAAVASIAGLSDYRGAPIAANTLFRGSAYGCSVGPFISQFLYRPCPFGAAWIDQRITPPAAGIDFMTNFTTYLAQQNGQPVEANLTLSSTPVFIRNGRDLAHWVHLDVLLLVSIVSFSCDSNLFFYSQAYQHAVLILLSINAPLKPGIPYTSSINQEGFATFGGPQIAHFSTHSAMNALKASWWQKWKVHRRLRPEVFGARVHLNKTGAYSYPIHPDLEASGVLPFVFAKYGSYMLGQCFPEGSPMHPSYTAGHAAVAGAATTMLKAFFNEDHVLSGNLMPSEDGETLVTLSPSATLTVGGELSKLATNIAYGRHFAGVHYRSDGKISLKLGEQVAISILRDMLNTLNEPFAGWSFKDFDGNLVVVN